MLPGLSSRTVSGASDGAGTLPSYVNLTAKLRKISCPAKLSRAFYFFFLLLKIFMVPPSLRYSFQPSSAPSMSAEADAMLAMIRFVGDFMSSSDGWRNMAFHILERCSSEVSNSSCSCCLRSRRSSKESMFGVMELVLFFVMVMRFI